MTKNKFAFADPHRATGRYYDNEDLKLFESLLREIFDDISRMDSRMCAPGNVDETRSRIAMAILAAAEAGESNPSRLKLAAIDRLF